MRTLILSGTILLAATASAAAQGADPVGEWLVEDGSARIKVVSCPQTAQNQPPSLWGVIWAETRPGTDSANPDKSMKGRPMLGVPILINMKQTQANLWTGKIYDARSGSLYDSKISLSKTDMLEVRGCVAGFLCGGQDWKRVTNTNTPPVHVAAPATPAPQAKGGAMAAQPQTTKGMAKGAPPAAAAAPAADPICSNVASLVPRS